MGSSEKFCLRWNDFESNISVAFRELREDKDFFDVTLACDDDQIQAHKVILSACSPFFRTILKRNRHEHPLLYLKGVKYADLVAVLNFMYHGEVNVAQEELNSFLSIAEDLQVKGLTQNKPDNIPRQKQQIQTPTKEQLRDSKRVESTPQPKRNQPVPVPAPKSRINNIQPLYQADEDDIQEVVPVKTEPTSLQTESGHPHMQEEQHQSQEVVDPNMENSIAMYEDGNYADYENYENDAEQTYDGGMVYAANDGVNKGAAESNPSPQERDNMFFVHMASIMDGVVKKWQCVLCGKMSKLKGDILDHVEGKHMENSFLYSCRYCSKVLNTNRKLRFHEYQHRTNEKHSLWTKTEQGLCVQPIKVWKWEMTRWDWASEPSWLVI